MTTNGRDESRRIKKLTEALTVALAVAKRERYRAEVVLSKLDQIDDSAMREHLEVGIKGTSLLEEMIGGLIDEGEPIRRL